MNLIVNNKYMSYLKQLENSYDKPIKFVVLVGLAKTQIHLGKYNTSELLNVWKKLMRGLKDKSESCEQNILCLLNNKIPLLNYAYDYEGFYDFIQYSTPEFYTKLIYILHKNGFRFDGFVYETKYSISQDFNRNCPLMNCIDLMIKHSKQNTFDSYSLKYEFMLEHTKHKTFIIQYGKDGIVRYETPLSIAQVSEPVINILVKYETKTPPNKKCTDCEPCYENFFKINVIQQRKNENKYRKLYDHLKKRKESMKGTSLNGVPNEVDLNAIDEDGVPNEVDLNAIDEKTMNRRNIPWNHNPNENYSPDGRVRKYPYVVVGGIGGSGTRMVASVLATLGLNIGSDLNESFDNLSYTLLFKHIKINESNYNSLYEILRKAIVAEKLSQSEIEIVNKMTIDKRPHHARTWLNECAKNIINITQHGKQLKNKYLDELPNISNRRLEGEWGWKEPNSHMILNYLQKYQKKTKFIMVVRNGLDMAFSSNQNQLRLWGPSIFSEAGVKYEKDKKGYIVYTPRLSLKYWTIVHRKIWEMSKKNTNTLFIINFDDMCLRKELWLGKLCDFLEIDRDVVNELVPLVGDQSAGIGRYKRELLKDGVEPFDAEDVEFVREMGFDTDGLKNVTLNTNYPILNQTNQINKTEKNKTRNSNAIKIISKNNHKRTVKFSNYNPYERDYPYVVIGAVGGSGTRLIANMMYAMGVNMGTNVNESFDNNVFVYLLRRVKTLELSNKEFDTYLDILYKTFGMKSGLSLTHEENDIINELSRTPGQQFKSGWLKMHAKIIRGMVLNPNKGLTEKTKLMFEKINSEINLTKKPLENKWGWKAPNSHVVMLRLHKVYPRMKYIMVIRNGLDMALSENMNQIILWGPLLFPKGTYEVDDKKELIPTPRLALKYWCIVHKRIFEEAKQMGKQLYLLNYEILCEEPRETIQDMLTFLNVKRTDGLVDTLTGLIKKSEGVNRYKNLSETERREMFDPEDVAYVGSLGFQTD